MKKLVEPVHNSGINVTTDNWFTSAKLADDLLHKQITLLGTVRKNRQDVPPQFRAAKGRVTGSSLFGFCQKQALVSYIPKKGKVVLLLSSMHDKKEVNETSGKPVMILDYNKTKAAVDRVDQLCHNYSVQRRTKRWPLAYFYNCLNLAAINAQVFFISKFPNWQAHSHRRRAFLENLGMQLLRAHLDKRKQMPRLPKPTQNALKICGFARERPVQEAEELPRKRRRCHICPSALDRKTADRCAQCAEPCCIDHKTVTVLCDNCTD